MTLFEQTIDNLGKIAENAIGQSDKDYVKGGILQCWKCNTAKQVKINIGGKEKIVFCLCQCKQEEQRLEEKRESEQKRKLEIKTLRINGISDVKIRKYSFSVADETRIIRNCHKYVDNWEEIYNNNSGLIFWGKPGSGKTFAAGCIANALIEKSIPVLVTSFPRILSAGYDKSDILKSMRKFDLVVIDDLGVERQNEYALETVYTIIDERYKANKPMIITTNLEYSELKNPKDIKYSRIYDRILGVCTPVCFADESRRIKEGENKLKLVKQIFGG